MTDDQQVAYIKKHKYALSQRQYANLFGTDCASVHARMRRLRLVRNPPSIEELTEEAKKVGLFHYNQNAHNVKLKGDLEGVMRWVANRFAIGTDQLKAVRKHIESKIKSARKSYEQDREGYHLSEYGFATYGLRKPLNQIGEVFA